LTVEFGFAIGQIHLRECLLHWIHDGLMALYFLLVGLEIKREVFNGQLSRPSLSSCPARPGRTGRAAPALTYLPVNADLPASRAAWAIPWATDIALGLGVLIVQAFGIGQCGPVRRRCHRRRGARSRALGRGARTCRRQAGSACF
jgi:Na+/H+ antiporter NhaA